MPEPSADNLAHLLPSRSLVSDVINLIHTQIKEGKWTTSLPSERKLCQQLQISRGTLRLALRKLQQENVVSIEPGQGTRILKPYDHIPNLPKTGSVGVLLPDHIDHLPYITSYILNGLREHLAKEGFRLDLHESRQFFQRRDCKALSKLAANHRHDCWLLTLTTSSVQKWFQNNKLAAIVIGAKHPNVSLPSISPDLVGIGRHAAGVLLGLKHRHIAYIRSSRARNYAGAALTEKGVNAAFSTSLAQNARITVLEFDEHREMFRKKLLNSLRQPTPPTGLLVGGSDHAVSTLTILMHAGYRVPEDISIICLADSPTIKRFTTPALAHYSISSFNQPLRIMRMIHQLLTEGSVRKRDILLFPKYYAGESIARYGGSPKD